MEKERVKGLVTEARARSQEIGRSCARLDVPWARCRFARGLREFLLNGLLGPAMDFYTRRRVVGRERFDGLEAPVVLVANHSSHMDTPSILRSLPRKWRQRTAVAAAADYFYRKRLVANAVSLLLNTVPMQRTGGGLDPSSTSHVDRLMDQRWNLLIFPEGTRSRDGRIGTALGRCGPRGQARPRHRAGSRVGDDRRHAPRPQVAAPAARAPASPPPQHRGPLRSADPRPRGRAPQRGHGARPPVLRRVRRRDDARAPRSPSRRTRRGARARPVGLTWRRAGAPLSAHIS